MIEFERRFLVDLPYLELIDQCSFTKYEIAQGYVCSDENAIVRLRGSIDTENNITWFVTVKKDTGEKGKNFEFEYCIDNGQPLFDMLDQKIEKTRHIVKMAGSLLKIEVDVFKNRHSGLVIAEVELADENQSAWLSENIPSWFGTEITGVREYSNFSLCRFGLPK